jgi:hypothetical protein
VNPDPDRIWGFDDQKLKKKNTCENFLYLFLITALLGSKTLKTTGPTEGF